MDEKKSKTQLLTGVRKKMALAEMWVGITRWLLREYPSPITLYKIIKKVSQLRDNYSNNNKIQKIAWIDGKYYLSPNFQGFPSEHFYRNVLCEAKKVTNEKIEPSENLRLVFLSITKKCPLNCEHCCEGDILNQKEILTRNHLEEIVLKLQNAGVPHFLLGGGEPLVRIKDLLYILKTAKKTSDFWVLTSGFNLTKENAHKLKKAGLTGLVISLDHYDEAAHNFFRRNVNAYKWVREAVQNAHAAQLGTALSICVTRSFCTKENLMKYAILAKDWGVPFIQIIEPRDVGNYSGMDVLLKKEHEDILEEFYLSMNGKDEYREYPIVLYQGYRQRRIGCIGSGNKYLYVDSDGNANTCPLCREKKGNILKDEINEIITGLKSIGCAKFEDFIL